MKTWQYYLLFTTVCTALVFVTIAVTKDAAPDQKEPVITDSLAEGFCNRLNCPETGRKTVVYYNKAGQVIAHYQDTMTSDDYQFYNHSQLLKHEETISQDSGERNISFPDNGAGY